MTTIDRTTSGADLTNDAIFAAHEGGKLGVEVTAPLATPRDLSIAYTPGVAQVSRAIASDRQGPTFSNRGSTERRAPSRSGSPAPITVRRITSRVISDIFGATGNGRPTGQPAMFCALNVLAVVSTFAHANTRFDPPRWYAFVFTTIRHHSLHHSTGYAETRCNYGNSLILLDRLFGTFGEGEAEIVPGVRVFHQTFGEGKVLAVEGHGERAAATVFFKAVGQKKLKLKFAGLQVAG